MISYNEILLILERFANNHKFNPRFYAEFAEQLPNLATEDIEFPVLFCNPVAGDTLENVDVTEVEIYCLDRLRKDRKNTNDVVSDTKQILSQDLTRWLEEGQQDVEIERTYPCQPYNNYLLDYTAGWSMRVRFQNERISICEVPVDDVTPEPVVCDPATVQNSDASYTASVASGGTLSLPDIDINVNGVDEGDIPSVTDVNVTLANNNGTVTPDAVNVTGSTVAITLPDSNPAPVGATLMKTGQTTSYATNDDGDLEAGRATDFFTLLNNNPFGNTNRFTDELGGQTYTNDIVIDWSTYDNIAGTVLGYDRTTLTGATWSAQVSAAAAVSIGSFTSGWRLTNDHEFHNVYSMQDTVFAGRFDGLRYAPFNISAGSYFWTSTSRDASFAVAHLLNNFGNFGVVIQNKGNSYPGLACRTFTVTGTTLT